MKRACLLIIIIILLVSFSGCSTTTITEHEGNYIYKANEDINIIDIDTREKIAVLKMSGVEILSNKPFTIKEKLKTDENGRNIYETVNYNQLIQVYYTYESSKGHSISSANFRIYDDNGTLVKKDPDIEYTPVQKNGTDSFVVALKNKSDSVTINFKYKQLQTTTTAKISLDVTEKMIDNAQSENSNLSGQDEQSTLNDPSVSASNQIETKQNKNLLTVLCAIIVFLLGTIIVLIIVIIILAKRRK